MSFASSPRRGTFLALGLSSLFLMASSSPQCARTSDYLFNPASTGTVTATVAECWTSCASTAKEARAAELERFVGAIQACDTPECHQQEAASHVLILRAITDTERDCKAICHSQGSGTGGN
jgi:hypothetical protein